MMIGFAMGACVLLLAIFRGYYTWTEETFNRLMYENQGAYTQSQREEVVARVEDVRTSLKTITAILEQCGSEEEMSQFDVVMKAMGERSDIQPEGVQYFSFKAINTDIMRKADQQVIAQLKAGEPVVSNVYQSKTDEKAYYGIAEPVFLGGEYVGFVRGIIKPDTLLYSNQSGFLRDETESYVIHANGNNVLMDYMEADDIVNLYESMKESCDEPEKIDALKEAMMSGKKLDVVQTTSKGETWFISCAALPYNDWLIFNTTYSDDVNSYIDSMAAEGRRMVVIVIIMTAVVIGLLLLLYYQNNKEQRYEQKRAVQIANFSDTVLCEYDLKKDKISCTSNITKMLAVEDVMLEDFHKYIKERELVYPEDKELLYTALSDIPADTETKEYEIRLKSSEQEYRWYAVHVIALYMKKRIPGQLILKVTDITESKKEVLGLLKKNEQDVLTGLLNREAFCKKVQKCLEEEKRGYLLVVDLDHFKQVNDRYGHQTGDELLKMTAECMRRCFRSEDYLGRFGGDEFLAFMAGAAAKEAAAGRAELLVKLISEIRIEQQPDLKISCSIGVAQYTGGSYKAFMEKADKAMYTAKENGRNSWILQ